MRQTNLINQIRESVSKGKVKEPFKATDFPCLKKSKSFLSKHAVGNKGNYTE